MGKKIFFLFTCLLFSAANAVAEDFSLEGGMTSDSLKIYGVKTTRLHKIPNQNTLLIDSNSTKSTLEFYVSVPEGKEAYFQSEVLLEVSSKTNDPRDLDRSSITYNINLNGENKVSHTGKTEISRIADKIDIPAGDANKITVEAIIKAKKCITAGSISNLSIHIHRFSEPEVLVEAECGKIGKSQTKCLVCGKSNTYTVMPAHAAHHLVMMPQKKGSCISTANKVNIAHIRKYINQMNRSIISSMPQVSVPCVVCTCPNAILIVQSLKSTMPKRCVFWRSWCRLAEYQVI